MAVNLPEPRSQAGGLPTVPSIQKSGTSAAQDILGVMSGLAPVVANVNQRKAKEAQQEQATRDDITVGNMIADLNQIELDQSVATNQLGVVQQLSLEVAAAYEDNQITDEEKIVLENHLKEEAKLKAMREQNPSAFSTQQSDIQRKVRFQQALRQHPRLGATLQKVYNTIGGNTTTSSNATKAVLETEAKITSIYGTSATPAQRLEFAQFQRMETRNAEDKRVNTIKAERGLLDLNAITSQATNELNVSLAELDTKFSNDLEAGGGYYTTNRARQYITQLKSLRMQLQNEVYDMVAKQNASGQGFIDRAAVQGYMDEIDKEINARIEWYSSNDTTALLKDVSEYQKLHMEVLGGNAAQVARQISGIKGDNIGALLSTMGVIKGSDTTVKGNLGKLYTGAGMDALGASVDELASRMAVMMNDPTKHIPEEWSKALVYHGVIAMREGPVSETVQTKTMTGVANLARKDGVEAAAKVLAEPSVSKRSIEDDAAKRATKTTINVMDAETLTAINGNPDLAVAYNPESDGFVVYDKARMKSRRTTFAGAMETARGVTDEDRIQKLFETTVSVGQEVFTSSIVNTKLTKDLNALYALRYDNNYSAILETPESFRQTWLDKFSLVEEQEESTNPTAEAE